jgi:predicted outer membrane repeat protein
MRQLFHTPSIHALLLALVIGAEFGGIDDLHAERVISDPPEPATIEPDTARPSASDRLAERGGQVITVGSLCDYENLSVALAAASDGDTILLERSADLYEGDTYTLQNRSLTIRGGYDNCTDPTPSGRTILDAAGNGRVFDLYLPPGETGPMDIVLENLTVRGGNAGSFGGGGLLIEGRQGGIQVELINVEVTGNASDTQNGGGIRVDVNDTRIGFEPMLTMDNDSSIIGNSTGGNGGGLACDNIEGRPLVGTLIRLGAVDVADNSAVNGGGLALSNCGTVFIYGGGPFFLVVPTGAIFGNTASGNGGGLFVEGETQVRVLGQAFSSDFGDPDNAAHIVSNQAERGGGVFASGSEAEVVLEDTVVNSNEATQDGGGIYADDFARVEQRRDPNTLVCESSDVGSGLATVPRCSRMVLNTAINGAGGGYFADTGAQV